MTGERPLGGRRRRRTGGPSGADEAEGEPRSLSEEVEARAQEEAHATSPQEERDLDFTPNGPPAQTQGRGTAYAKEYRMTLLHRLLLRRVPLEQIASQLSVDVSTVMRDRKELYKRMREEAKNLDIHRFIGDTLGFYNEVVAMSLRSASHNKTPMNTRLAALRTALAGKNHMTRFLEDTGVLEVLKFEPNKNEGTADLEKIVALTNALVESDSEAMSGLTLPEGMVLDDDEEDIELI